MAVPCPQQFFLLVLLWPCATRWWIWNHGSTLPATIFFCAVVTLSKKMANMEPWQYPARISDSVSKRNGIAFVTLSKKMANMEPWQYPARISDSVSKRNGIAFVTLSKKIANMEPWQYLARIGDSISKWNGIAFVTLSTKLANMEYETIVIPCPHPKSPFTMNNCITSACCYGSQRFISRLCLFVVFFGHFFFSRSCFLVGDGSEACYEAVCATPGVCFFFCGKPQPMHTFIDPIHSIEFFGAILVLREVCGILHEMTGTEFPFSFSLHNIRDFQPLRGIGGVGLCEVGVSRYRSITQWSFDIFVIRWVRRCQRLPAWIRRKERKRKK